MRLSLYIFTIKLSNPFNIVATLQPGFQELGWKSDIDRHNLASGRNLPISRVRRKNKDYYECKQKINKECMSRVQKVSYQMESSFEWKVA